MKKNIIAFFVLVVLMLQVVSVNAISADEAKENWKDLKKVSKEKQEEHRDAKIEYATDKSEENNQAVVDTGKDVLHAALDEAEAWLDWKHLEINENKEVPDDLEDKLLDDIDANLETIEDLRKDVDGITNQLELGIVFLKMIGKYLDLLTDVARNSGLVWAHIGNERIDDVEEYEAKLRDAAGDDEDVIEILDSAKDSIEEAQSNVDKAEESYEEVVAGGNPLIKFSEGNNYLRTARINLISAHADLNKAYGEILRGDEE